ncbi:MAG: hypothetical protein M3296_01110 [Actinomycetota bacterium]|nr:hypothetical protein [Actinomycetota bacterium]
MAEISLTSTGPRDYEVHVDDGGRRTRHEVTVPTELIDRLGPAADDLEAVVRESFRFLLERESASSILPSFSLDVISRYFPEYDEELPRRLG